MAFREKGLTLMEVIVVLIIIGIAAALAFPSYSTSTEQARSSAVKNNLLAIYSAEQNYNNNYGTYCLAPAGQPACAAVSATCAGTLAAINCNLSLNTQDDGTYTYACAGATCTATRVGNPTTNLVLTLNQPTNLTGVGPNPVCNTANNYCPQ